MAASQIVTGHDPDLQLALALSDTADAITLRRFTARDLRVDRKPDRTPVTDADLAVEDAVRAVLAAQRPDDTVVGEERGGSETGGRAWVLDPIDGTKNFLRGLPAWATLIALVSGGRPVVGVASAPALGRRWWAADGAGATVRGPDGAARPISVSGVSELADAY
ncbi:MAG: inositol monophosphatase family protein, partial [Pseudonocardiaceae bacterium]